jgi:hypothetical protein
MQHALPHPHVHMERSAVVAFAALVLGAGAAVGIYSAVDQPDSVAAPASQTRVISIPPNNMPDIWPNERPPEGSAATADTAATAPPRAPGAGH